MEVTSDQRVRDLEQEVVNLRAKVQQLDAENRDLRYAEEVIRELPPETLATVVPSRARARAASQDTNRLQAQIDILRQHLRQELAVNEYLAENQKEGVAAFNTLPVETRKAYFQKVDAKL